MEKPLLRLKNLSFSYNSRDFILKNLSLSLERGDFLFIVGPNGSGKTTLLRLILGLEKPTSGSLASPRKIAYLPQESHLDPTFPASVEEVVLSGALNRPGLHTFYKKSEKTEALEHLSRLKLKNLRDKPFSSLSGGQKQKVLLARALMSSSELLVLDEPSNHLDLKSRTELYKTIKNLNKSANLTIIMVTHAPEEASSLGTKILKLPEGTLEKC